MEPRILDLEHIVSSDVEATREEYGFLIRDFKTRCTP